MSAVTAISRPWAPAPSLDHVNARLHVHIAALRCLVVVLQQAAQEPGPFQGEIDAAQRVLNDTAEGLESARDNLDRWVVGHQGVTS